MFQVADLAFARKALGERVYYFIERSPNRTLDPSGVTGCVKSWWPRAATKNDAVIWLDIGDAREFARLLFSQSATSLLDETIDANKTAGHEESSTTGKWVSQPDQNEN